MLEQKLWDLIRKNLEKPGQNSHIFHSVTSQARLESNLLNGKKLFTLKVPSRLHQNILRNYLPKITEHIKKQNPKNHLKEDIIIYPQEHPKNPITFCQNSKELKKTQNSSQLTYLKRHPESSNSFIKTRNFSRFIQGSSNCFALAVAKSIAANPANNHSNPFFIYGNSGLGKTHLLHAIGLQVEQKHPHLKIKYLSAERFFNECIFHIRKNEMDKFRQKYRQNIDILLLDDVQILGRGESTQEEFFHTFEALIQSNCQIVLASDTAPKNIKGLKTRIKTRFGGGVIADIQSPDSETKLAILKNKASLLKLPLSDELFSYILKIPTDSIREIEGCLNKVKIFCELQQTKPSLEVLEKLFPLSTSKELQPCQKKAAKGSTKLKDTLVTIQEEVCFFFQLKNTAELFSRNRHKKNLLARNVAMYIARENFQIPLAELGRAFGGRDHSTVIKAIQKIRFLLVKDKSLKPIIQKIQQNIHKKHVNKQA